MRLVMLDRDGVLNVDRPDSVKNPGELAMIAGAATAVARLNRAGVTVAVVTNQSVVGRGIIDPAMLETIHRHLRDNMAADGAALDDIVACTDRPDTPNSRRKPSPAMLQEVLRHFRLAPGDAVFIGDSLRDLEAAARAGCARILVRTGKGAATQATGLPERVLPVAVYDDLADAVDALLARPDPSGSDARTDSPTARGRR